MDRQWSTFFEKFGDPESPFARVNPHIALIVVEKWAEGHFDVSTASPSIFRLREGLKRPLLKNFNRPVMEKENIRILETVAKDLRSLINETS